jgi:hypothetical protein
MIASPQASSRCSQLSRTRRILRSPMNRSTVSIGDRPGWSGRPMVRATVTGTTTGSATGAKSTYHTASWNSLTNWPESSTARRVLPAPPVPVSVTNRFSSSSRCISSICPARPTKLVNSAGRL